MNSLVKDAQKAGERVGLKSDQIVITGGNPLKGRIRVRGAKNLATKAMVAALLGETPSVLRDVPDISDVDVVRGLLEVYGVVVTSTVPGELQFDTSNVERAHFAEIDAHAGSSRIPILFCGPLLHRLGEALIPDLGGCRIGDRPIDFHLDALRAFGAVVDKSYEGIRLTAPNGLKGANIELPYPSVGATEQVLLTAVRAEGHDRAEERGDRARDHGSHRHPAEDGRHHLGRAQPRDLHRGRRPAPRLQAPRAVRPQRGRELGIGRARDRRRHLRRGRASPS